jgi:hypothetical protein
MAFINNPKARTSGRKVAGDSSYGIESLYGQLLGNAFTGNNRKIMRS